MLKYRFIISIFGNHSFGMLAPLLYSIKETNPQASASIFWEEIDIEKISLIKKAFSEFEFIETDFKFSKDIIKRISSKTLAWEYASRIKPDETLIFVDADTLIIKNLSPIIEKCVFDIIFTKKNELYPINTGVMICKNDKKTRIFFELWRNKTMSILNDKTLFAQSGSRDFPYGGADQMALYKILDFDIKKENYSVKIGTEIINAKSMPCFVLNETNSTKIAGDTHIIHYKGGWQPILIDGFCFTENRTKKDSWEMYIHYLKTFLKTVDYINKKTISNFKSNFFGIKVPFYLNRKTWKENKILYFFYFVKSFILKNSRRLKNINIRKKYETKIHRIFS